MSEIDDLRRRLAAAERVCYLVGITGAPADDDRGKAKTQAWMEWAHDYRPFVTPVTDDEILALAARRDIIRNNTLAKLRAKTKDHLDQECRATLLEAIYERQHEPEVTHTWGDWQPCAGYPEFQQRDCLDKDCRRVQTRRIKGPA